MIIGFYRKKIHTLDSIDSLLGIEIEFGNPYLCSGKGSSGSGGGGTTTTNTTSSPPPQVLAAYEQALSSAQSAASAPLQQYGGPEVAGFTPDQLQAFQTVSGTAGAYQPYLNTASTDIQNSTTPLWNNVQQFSPQAVQQYESPYTQDVLNTTMAAENNQDAQQQTQLQGNAISSGAWGGDRSAVAQAQLAGQQDIANNQTNAGIENTGYTNALGEFNTQQQQQLSANEANSYLSSQAGFGNINLANTATGLPLEQASAENTTGSEEQALGQSILNVPYEQFLQQQAYPFQTAQYYTNAAEGLGQGEGQSGTGSTTSPGASTTSQVAGGLLGAGSLGYLGYLALSDRRAKKNVKEIGEFKDYPLYSYEYKGSDIPQMGVMAQDVEKTNPKAVHNIDGMKVVDYAQLAGGGRIHRDVGGNIPNIDVNFIPLGNSPGTKQLTMPNPPKSSGQNQPSLTQTISGLQGLSGLAKALGNSGAGSPGMTPSASNIFGNDTGGSFGEDTALANAGLDSVGDDMGSFLSPGVVNATEGITFNHGGRTHYDDGGGIGAVSGVDPTAYNSPQQAQGFYQQVQQLPMDKLQELQLRMPPSTPQGQMVQRAIKQKQFMPNQQQQQSVVSSAPTAAASPQASSPLQQAGLASGGRPRFDDGGTPDDGSYPPPPTPDQIDLQQEVANEPSVTDPLQQYRAENGLSTAPIDTQRAGMGLPVGSQIPIGGQQLSSNEDSESVSGLQTTSVETPSSRPKPSKGNEINLWEALAAAGFGMMAGTSPQAGVNIGRGALTGLQDVGEQHKQNLEQQKQGAEETYRDTQVKQEAAKLAQQANQFQQEHTTMTPYQQAEVENQRAERQKPIPDGMGGFIVPNPKDPTSPLHIEGTLAASLKTDPATGQPLTGQAFLDNLKTKDPAMAAQVKAMDEGDLNFPTGFAAKAPYWQQRLNALYQYNPNASQQTSAAYKQFMSGPLGNTTRNLNVATNHINLVNGLVDALDNGDTKAINSISNTLKTQLGLSSAPTNLDAAKQLAANEIVKATTGSSGALGDRETIEKNISSANSPKLLKDAMNIYFGMMGGQFQGLKQQYETQTQRHDFDRFLSPAAQQAIGHTQTNGSTPQPNVPASISAIPSPDQRVKGQAYTNPNGHSAVWTGTGWAQP